MRAELDINLLQLCKHSLVPAFEMCRFFLFFFVVCDVEQVLHTLGAKQNEIENIYLGLWKILMDMVHYFLQTKQLTEKIIST